MGLGIQIKSLIFSFIFGCIFYFLLDLFNRFSKKLKIVLKIFVSLIFVLLVSSVYFIVLLYVNNGVVHIYFLLSIMVGYLCVYFLYDRLLTLFQKK